MDKWDSPGLAGLGATPAAVAVEALGLLKLPDSSELAAVVEDGVKTLDAALAVGQPAILADFLGYAATRLDVLAHGSCDRDSAIATFRGLVRSRLAPGEAVTVEDFLDRALALTRWLPPEAPDAAHFGPLAHDYLDLVLDGRRDEARALVRSAVHRGADVRAIVTDILEPAQREIGRRWQIGEISVAQEHYCTAVTQQVLTDLQPLLFTGLPRTRRLVAVDAPGSLHQVGLRMVVDLLEYEGWETTYLAATSPEEVAEEVAGHGALVLAISASMPGQVPGVTALIAAVRADPRSRNVKVLVGGRPFTVAPDLVAVVGADAWAASAADAVAACNRLAGVTS